MITQKVSRFCRLNAEKTNKDFAREKVISVWRGLVNRGISLGELVVSLV